ncbi:MAG: SoxR reducing system RseC family protein [Odoribacter sp.]|nr:SoxR reducing system RseC family protein [Odoribacter sp.]
MAGKERVQHEGVVKSISDKTLEVLIVSHSACSGCHAKGACGMDKATQKIITVPLPEGEFHVGDKVTVYASLGNAFYSVLLAYVVPSVLVIASIFFLEMSGSNELTAAVYSLLLLVLYFGFLYLLRHKISKKITFTTEKTNNY